VPRTAARCALIVVLIVLSCAATACSQVGSVKQTAVTVALSADPSVTPAPPATTTPAATTPAATITAPTATATVTAPTKTATVTASPAKPTTSPASPTSPTSPTSATVTATATPTPTGASKSGSSLVWLWVVLAAAAVVVIALVTWIVSASGRRRTAKADWQTRMIDAYSRGAALHDAMAVAEAPGALSSPDAPVRWSEIQRRADDFAQTLYRLREFTTDDEDRIRIDDVLASLQATRSAMEAERSGQYAAGAMSDVVRDRLASFMAALQDLRDPRVWPA
jgi:flagellar basal body-associated protein FliL